MGSARTWTTLGVLVPLGMMLSSGTMLLELRRDAWEKAAQTSDNLMQVIERDIARNVEILDLSLRGAAENLKASGLGSVGPELRRLVLFDRAASARDLGVMLVLDERGDIVEDAGSVPPRRGNYADRDYFEAQRAERDLGLYVGRPLVSRLTGERMLPFSRRIDKPDGSFGGVALCTLKLSYFTRLFDQLGLGPDGGINLYHRDGTRIMRQPFVEGDIGANIAGTPNFDRFARDGRGSFVGRSVRDGVERFYTFTGVGDLPLILNVALSTRTIEAGWWPKALVICGALVVLSGLTVSLCLLFGRELRRRAAIEAELERLSLTDGLTELPNRRRFERALAGAWASLGGSGRGLAILVVDVDHFKRLNDRHGHAVGDEVLKAIARALGNSVHRPEDLVCRIGGEEFALVLPATDATGASRVAEKVHDEVARLDLAAAGVGSVTVSVGVAPSADPAAVRDPTELFRLADEALYRAKAGGRNQTRSADADRGSRERTLRLAGNE